MRNLFRDFLNSGAYIRALFWADEEREVEAEEGELLHDVSDDESMGGLLVAKSMHVTGGGLWWLSMGRRVVGLSNFGLMTEVRP